MQTQYDSDHNDSFLNRWLESLEAKADKMVAEKQSQITAGSDGEQVLDEWHANGVSVRQLPDDEHGILRISIGGGETPVGVNYCVFRGSKGKCIDLLRKALLALVKGDER